MSLLVAAAVAVAGVLSVGFARAPSFSASSVPAQALGVGVIFHPEELAIGLS